MVENLKTGTLRRLPPLNALRAFEAAARHGSLSKAADELSVTPGAVSQQIRQLEEALGLALFRRHARGVALTDEGAAALPVLSDAFDRLRQAAEVLSGAGDQSRVRVGAPAGFARKWLIPRLADFTGSDGDKRPVSLATDVAPGELERLRVDVEIRFGSTDYPGCETRRLLTETISPVAAPDLLDQFGLGGARQALERLPLIHDVCDDAAHGAPDWASWLAQTGVEREDAHAGDRLRHSDHVVDAAVAGRGVALARRTLAYDDLAAGRLAPILAGGVVELGGVYTIVWPQGRRLGTVAKDFIAYMQGAAAPFEHMGV